jgi:hypothetical protein
MGIDTIKIAFTYGIALVILVGGLLILWGARLDPPGTSDDLSLAIIGFMGVALNFVFMRETASNSARQTERAVAIQAPPAKPSE